MIEGIYKTAYGIWNSIITIAMTLFTTSPMAANGSVYETTHTLFLAISDISVPVAIVFFLIAICKDVLATPPEHQWRKLLNDLVRYGLIVAVITNLWDLMGAVMGVADGITNRFSISAEYTLSISEDLRTVISESTQTPTATISLMTFGEDLKNFISAWISYVFRNIVFTLAALVTLLVIIASAISILSSSYQRILKPLVILPFSSITIAMGAGAGDASRVAVSYMKTFFGFCISGALMVICVKLGVSLSDGLVAFELAALDSMEKVLYISIQNAVTPIIIAGLVKSVDSIVGRMF